MTGEGTLPHNKIWNLKILAAAISLVAIFPTIVSARDLSNEEKKIVSEVVARDFKDPASAMFRWLPIADLPPGGANYCGTVNAKNSFGAYEGYEPFMVFLMVKNNKLASAMLLTIGSPADPAAEQVTTATCQKFGHDTRLAN